MNLLRAQLFGASINEPAGSGNFEVVSASRRAYGYANPPRRTESDQFAIEHADPAQREFVETAPPYVPAVRSILALARLDQLAQQTGIDRTLSDEGRRLKLAEPGAATARTLAQQQAAVSTFRTDHTRRFGELYDPPRIAPNDLSSFLEDREIRDHVRSLQPSGRAKLASTMVDGSQDRVALAILRTPVPLMEPDLQPLIVKGWRASVAKREPEKAAALGVEDRDIAWAERVVSTSAQYAKPLLPARLELWRAVREIPAARDLYRFEPAEIEGLEHRIARANAT